MSLFDGIGFGVEDTSSHGGAWQGIAFHGTSGYHHGPVKGGHNAEFGGTSDYHHVPHQGGYGVQFGKAHRGHRRFGADPPTTATAPVSTAIKAATPPAVHSKIALGPETDISIGAGAIVGIAAWKLAHLSALMAGGIGVGVAAALYFFWAEEKGHKAPAAAAQ